MRQLLLKAILPLFATMVLLPGCRALNSLELYKSNPIEFKLNGERYVGWPTVFAGDESSLQSLFVRRIKITDHYFKIAVLCPVKSGKQESYLRLFMQIHNELSAGCRYEFSQRSEWNYDSLTIGEHEGTVYDIDDLVSGWVEFSEVKYLPTTGEYVLSGDFEFLFEDENGNQVRFTDGKMKSYKLIKSVL